MANNYYLYVVFEFQVLIAEADAGGGKLRCFHGWSGHAAPCHARPERQRLGLGELLHFVVRHRNRRTGRCQRRWPRRCSAEWHSAVSRIVNPPRFRRVEAANHIPAARPNAIRRHSRLPVCATGGLCDAALVAELDPSDARCQQKPWRLLGENDRIRDPIGGRRPPPGCFRMSRLILTSHAFESLGSGDFFHESVG